MSANRILARHVCALVAVATAVWATGALAFDPLPAEPTEAQVRGEYDRARTHWQSRTAGQKEHDVRHILAMSRNDAEAALARLAKGEKFEDVARTASKDPGSAAKGGSLGWSLPTDFVESFAKAMTELAPAGMSREPVRSQFGWHVIQVLGVREPVFPPFEEVKDRVRQSLRQQWLSYDGSGIYAREVDVRSLSVRGDKIFFRYRERLAYGSQPETTGRPIAAVVDCARQERADVGADGSFALRSVYPDTAQARQLKFVCDRAPQTTAAASPPAAPPALPDVGLTCDSPLPQLPAGFTRERGFPDTTVVVRGQVTAPAAALGEMFVEVPSGYAAIDQAALKAFGTMKCSTRVPLQESRWVRRSFVFKLEDAKQ